ncbi:MAG: hypothetical protein V5A43_08985 [Haloarculaceae archaeon]
MKRDADASAHPPPTVVDRGTREVGAAVEADSLQVVLDVLKLQRGVRDWLNRARTERFRAGGSPFAVAIADAGPNADIELLPRPNRTRLEHSADERWHDIHRAMVLAGYPPGAADGQCDRAEAVAAMPPGECANDRTIVCDADAIEPGPAGESIRLSLDGGRASVEVALETDEDATTLLAEAGQVHLTHHSAAALEAARSLGGALADTPPLAVLFEPPRIHRRYGALDHGVGTVVEESVVTDLLEAPPLPDASGLASLDRALARGPFTTRERLAIARLAAGDTDRIRLRYGTGVPLLVAGVAAVTSCEIVPIPQSGDVLLTRTDTPEQIEGLAGTFPEDQRLERADRQVIGAALGRPDHAIAAPDRADHFRAGECCAELAEAGDLSVVDAFCLEVSPWVPEPRREAVMADVELGRQVARSLLAYDASADATLGAEPLRTCWQRAGGSNAGSLPID